jgi:small-conductance mechanosensitive channel
MVQHGFDVVVRSLAIVSLAWFALRALMVSAGEIARGAKVGPEDNARARGIQTQFALLRRVAQVAIWIIAAALLLMQFELVRSVGLSLLASAGVAGLVIGLAAQKSIATLLAGIQLSLTQPIRIGDYVVLEGESGVVEEIGFTFVVVRVWDGRRMVVPITYFMEQPFQNWNKGDPKQLGAVMLEVDFGADLEVFRAALREVLAGPGKDLWDGETQGIVITDAKERTMTLRALVGAKRFSVSWDLRCLVRERLIRVLQEHPDWLPRLRTGT